VRYICVYSDPDGDSHFEEAEAELKPVDVAAPAPPVNVATAMPLERLMLMSFPQGWSGDWHPAPRRQFFIQLSGELEICISDGRVAPSLLGRSFFWKTYRVRAISRESRVPQRSEESSSNWLERDHEPMTRDRRPFLLPWVKVSLLIYSITRHN